MFMKKMWPLLPARVIMRSHGKPRGAGGDLLPAANPSTTRDLSPKWELRAAKNHRQGQAAVAGTIALPPEPPDGGQDELRRGGPNPPMIWRPWVGWRGMPVKRAKKRNKKETTAEKPKSEWNEMEFMNEYQTQQSMDEGTYRERITEGNGMRGRKLASVRSLKENSVAHFIPYMFYRPDTTMEISSHTKPHHNKLLCQKLGLRWMHLLLEVRFGGY